MRKLSVIILLFFATQTIFGQSKTERIKVILFGTFHMRPTSDRNKTEFPDLLTEKRQLELDSISNSITIFGISKYFVEIKPIDQKKW